MRKLTVLCDLDAIVADLLTPWLATYNASYNDNLTVDMLTKFEIHNFVKPECGSKIYDFFGTGEAYRSLTPLDGAVEAIHTIEKMGHNVVIVSAGAKPLSTAGDKLEWCQTVLGFGRRKCIIAHQKELIRGDLFIDDSPDNIKRYRAAWPETPIFTISYPYNEEVADICIRFPDWRNTREAWAGMVEGVRLMAMSP